MGEAKRRGNAEQRQRQARQAQRSRFPASVKCNECQADLTDIIPMDTRGLPGMRLAGAAHCPACGSATWVLDGTPDALQAFREFIASEAGGEVKSGTGPKSR